MKYGCIGEHLAHSFSKEIHALIADYDYELKELAPDEVESFIRHADFEAINVTIPYKEKVIPFIDVIDEGAELIGAVNTVVKRDGLLYGYNTDFYGMSALARRTGIDFSDKKVLVLGTGGTSATAVAVARAEGAREVIKVSRKPGHNEISYADATARHRDAEIIINTTPVGMYPRIFGKPIELRRFTRLEGVLDAIYNPIKTPLILEAESRGVRASGGLYMLVAQAVRASEHFLGAKYPSELSETVYKKILSEKKNIVLIGMPASGKTTVGRIIAEKLSRELIDTDEMITSIAGADITTIFEKRGEEVFRDIESLAADRACAECGKVIATGGGVPLRAANVHSLRENGKIYFIDRPLSALIPTEDRPTASTKDAIAKRYAERYELYKSVADVTVDASGTAEETAERIIADFLK